MSSTAPLLIFDVGLNIGQDTGFYLFQGHRVVAVEADPTLAEAARQRFQKEIQEGRLEIVNVGIADREGTAEFWVCEDKPEFNSFYREIAARDGYAHHSIEVPIMRFSKVIEQFGTPHFLKIDIEGHDMLCLEGLSPTSLPAYVSIESECPLGDGEKSVNDGLRSLDKLYELGYRQFKLIEQDSFCALTKPPSLPYLADKYTRRLLESLKISKLPGTGLLTRPLLTRRRLESRLHYRFPHGSSGPWGEDTPGSWIGYDQASETYRHYWNQHFASGEAKFYTFWCDWHAKA